MLDTQGVWIAWIRGQPSGCVSELNTISKAFEVCPSLLLIKLLFFMSSQIVEQMNTLIPHIIFRGGGGIWLQRVLTVASTDSLSSATSRLMLKKKISFKNIWEKGWAVLFNRHFSYDLLTTSLFFFTMPCVLYANIFNNIITLCCRQISVSCFQGTLAQ